PSLLQEGIRAKFTQNKRLSRRLLDTRDAKLVDEKNPLTGTALKKVRDELRKSNTESSSISTLDSFNSDKIKDLKSTTLSSQEKKFVIRVISIAKRISEMEGWDKIFKEMIEYVVYILSSNKKEITGFFNYINFFYKIPWTEIYHDLPNTYEIIHEIQETFQEIDNSKGSQRYITIVAMLNWVNIEATIDQKKNIYKKIRRADTLHISIPKVQRWYRQQQPPLPVKKNRNEVKNSEKKNNSRSHTEKSLVLLTPLEKEAIHEILEDQDCQGSLDQTNIKDVQKIVRKKIKGSTVNRKELRKYVADTYNEIVEINSDKVEHDNDISDDIGVLTSREKKSIHKVLKTHQHGLGNVNKKYIHSLVVRKLGKLFSEIEMKSDFEQYITGVCQEILQKDDLGNFNPSESNIEEVGLPSSPLEHTQETLTIENIHGGNFFIQGSPLDIYTDKLLHLGGKFSKMENGSVDKSRMEFGCWARDQVMNIIFDSLGDYQKYTIAYQKWVKNRLLDFVDTSIQICYLLNKSTITDDIICVVIENIYGYMVNDYTLPSDIEFGYIDDTIRSIFSQRKEYGQYKLNSEATELLTLRIKNLGKFLIHKITTSMKKNPPTYQNLKKRFQELEDNVGRIEICSTVCNFTPSEIYILRALRHISACFKNLFLYPFGMEMCVRTFLVLVPPEWRVGAEQYMSVTLKNFDEKMDIEEMQSLLEKSDIKYNISDILQVIQYYDTETKEHQVPSGKLLSSEEIEEYRYCIVVFAISLTYLTSSLSGPHTSHVLKRVKNLGTGVSPDVKVTLGNDESSLLKRKRLITPHPKVLKNIPKTGYSLTTFQESDIIVVLVDSKSTTMVEADPITASVFKTYPYSNIYTLDRFSEGMGTVILKIPIDPKSKTELSSTPDHRIVACLVCNFSMGGPAEMIDTVKNRKKWFTSALIKLFNLPEVKGKKIAFAEKQLYPGGYVETVKDLAKALSLTVYVLDGETIHRNPSEKAKNAISKDLKFSSSPSTENTSKSPEELPETTEDTSKSPEELPETTENTSKSPEELPETTKDTSKSPEELPEDQEDTLLEDPLEELSDSESSEDVPPDIKKAALYLSIFNPLKLPSKQYSLIVEKLAKLPEKERKFYLNRWSEISVSERKDGVNNFLAL
ncbi:MAG: hypothetical protein JKY53_13105, partial [Flavobacteriales bacterium]|nr:hypothetical protein [Flavobacteriales bacterium]